MGWGSEVWLGCAKENKRKIHKKTNGLNLHKYHLILLHFSSRELQLIHTDVEDSSRARLFQPRNKYFKCNGSQNSCFVMGITFEEKDRLTSQEIRNLRIHWRSACS